MNPPEVRWVVPADLAGLARLQADAADWLRRAGVEERAAGRVLLAFDEVAANIVHHAALPPGAGFEVRLAPHGGDLRACFSDEGRPFDPTAAVPPVVPATLDEVPAGGFGLGLVRCLCRSMEYRRDGRRNHLSLRFAAVADPHAPD